MELQTVSQPFMNLIRELQDIESYKHLYWEGSFEEYLDLVRKNPKVARTAFQRIYDMIYMQEKDMQGERIESPPWDKKIQPIQKIKEAVNGVKMYFKLKDIFNSAKITPVESEKDVRSLFKKFMSMMMEDERGSNKSPKGESDNKDNKNIKGNSVEEDIWESKEAITGEIIFN